MKASWLLPLAACGRVDFQPAPLACGIAPTAPDTLRLAGTTFAYTSFNNTIKPVPDVPITVAYDGETVLATSQADGSYAIEYPTDGIAHPLVIAYAPAGYFTSTVFTDQVVDRDITGATTGQWRLGDAPVWPPSAMTAIYAASGETRDPTRGSLNVAVRDCDGNGVAGAEVTISPPPGRLVYQDVDGSPSDTLAHTVDPFAHAIAHNAAPGLTTITARKDGRVFAETLVTVGAGNQVTLAIVRAVD